MLTYTVETESGKVFAQGMLVEKNFSSGNDGYFGNDKTALPKVSHLTGQRIVMTLKDGDRVMGSFSANMRKFSTGSFGYWGGGKCFTNSGEEVQAQIQLVLIKSKGIEQTALGALDNKYQVQAQAVLLNGMHFTKESPTTLAEETALAFAGK